MIRFPNAKINLGLTILRKRADNFHDLETVFYPVPFSDVLEVIKDRQEKSISTNNYIDHQNIELENKCKLQFFTSGIKVDGEPGNNLCIKAILAFQKQFGTCENLTLHLHKIIPMGAGLGGGSSDAVFTLQLLNELYNFPASQNQLHGIAETLGSDCSFFILNKPVFATGKGDQFENIEISLKGYKILIIKPAISVSTVEAFKGIEPVDRKGLIKDVMKTPIDQWKNLLVNDFEISIFKKYPVVQRIKEKLMDSGAIYASMSGSGSAVYGLFKNELPSKEEFLDCSYFKSELN